MAASPELFALGRAIRRARLDRDLTQEALAERAGLAPKTMSEIERGTRNIRTMTVVKVINGLNMPAADLYALYDRSLAGDSLAAE